ncbi:MAG: patatin-like phospholipase family protein, partial [Candidatus Omnitrophica bacterium]|nr:patatin-like phospholipase family protein [Candidatus Omnitrophota bacterium]
TQMQNDVVIRVKIQEEIPGEPTTRSFYFFDDHGRSVGYAMEAAWRGEMPPTGNHHIFVDDHADAHAFVGRGIDLHNPETYKDKYLDIDMKNFVMAFDHAQCLGSHYWVLANHRYYRKGPPRVSPIFTNKIPNFMIPEKDYWSLADRPVRKPAFVNIDTDATGQINMRGYSMHEDVIAPPLKASDFSFFSDFLIRLKRQDRVKVSCFHASTSYQNEADNFGDIRIVRFLAIVAPVIFLIPEERLPFERLKELVRQAMPVPDSKRRAEVREKKSREQRVKSREGEKGVGTMTHAPGSMQRPIEPRRSEVRDFPELMTLLAVMLAAEGIIVAADQWIKSFVRLNMPLTREVFDISAEGQSKVINYEDTPGKHLLGKLFLQYSRHRINLFAIGTNLIGILIIASFPFLLAADVDLAMTVKIAFLVFCGFYGGGALSTLLDLFRFHTGINTFTLKTQKHRYDFNLADVVMPAVYWIDLLREIVDPVIRLRVSGRRSEARKPEGEELKQAIQEFIEAFNTDASDIDQKRQRLARATLALATDLRDGLVTFRNLKLEIGNEESKRMQVEIVEVFLRDLIKQFQSIEDQVYGSAIRDDRIGYDFILLLSRELEDAIIRLRSGDKDGAIYILQQLNWTYSESRGKTFDMVHELAALKAGAPGDPDIQNELAMAHRLVGEYIQQTADLRPQLGEIIPALEFLPNNLPMHASVVQQAMEQIDSFEGVGDAIRRLAIIGQEFAENRNMRQLPAGSIDLWHVWHRAHLQTGNVNTIEMPYHMTSDLRQGKPPESPGTLRILFGQMAQELEHLPESEHAMRAVLLWGMVALLREIDARGMTNDMNAAHVEWFDASDIQRKKPEAPGYYHALALDEMKHLVRSEMRSEHMTKYVGRITDKQTEGAITESLRHSSFNIRNLFRRSEMRGRDLDAFMLAVMLELDEEGFTTGELREKGLQYPYDHVALAKRRGYLEVTGRKEAAPGRYTPIYRVTEIGKLAGFRIADRLQAWQIPYLFALQKVLRRRPKNPNILERFWTADSRIRMIPEKMRTLARVADVLGVKEKILKTFLEEEFPEYAAMYQILMTEPPARSVHGEPGQLPGSQYDPSRHARAETREADPYAFEKLVNADEAVMSMLYPILMAVSTETLPGFKPFVQIEMDPETGEEKEITSIPLAQANGRKPHLPSTTGYFNTRYARIGSFRFVDHRLKPYLDLLLNKDGAPPAGRVIYLHEMESSFTSSREDNLEPYVYPMIAAIDSVDMEGVQVLEFGAGVGEGSYVAFRKGGFPILVEINPKHRQAYRKNLELNVPQEKWNRFRYIMGDINDKKALLPRLKLSERFLRNIGAGPVRVIMANLGEHPWLYVPGTHLNAISYTDDFPEVEYYILGGYVLGWVNEQGQRPQDAAFAEAKKALRDRGFREIRRFQRHLYDSKTGKGIGGETTAVFRRGSLKSEGAVSEIVRSQTNPRSEVRRGMFDFYFKPKAFERDGKFYRRFGIRGFKKFFEKYHLIGKPDFFAARSDKSLETLKRRLENIIAFGKPKEIIHLVTFLASLPVSAVAGYFGYFFGGIIAAAVGLFYGLYPVMLNRYTRALAYRRLRGLETMMTAGPLLKRPKVDFITSVAESENIRAEAGGTGQKIAGDVATDAQAAYAKITARLRNYMQNKELIHGVFQGGGVKGITYVGALEELEEQRMWFASVAGTSAGAIVASLIAAGFEPVEIKKILFETDFNLFKDKTWGWVPPFLSLLIWGGAYRGEAFEQAMDKVLKEKLGFSPTLKDLPIPLTVIASDISNEKMLILDKESYPHLSVAQAVRMSMSIPLIFRPVKLTDGFSSGTKRVVDGALLSNFPLDIAQKRSREDGRRLVGFLLQEHHGGNGVSKVIQLLRKAYTLADVIIGMIRIVTGAHYKPHIEDEDWARIVHIPVGDVSAWNFSLSDNEKRELVEKGRKAAREHLGSALGGVKGQPEDPSRLIEKKIYLWTKQAARLIHVQFKRDNPTQPYRLCILTPFIFEARPRTRGRAYIRRHARPFEIETRLQTPREVHDALQELEVELRERRPRWKKVNERGYRDFVKWVEKRYSSQQRAEVRGGTQGDLQSKKPALLDAQYFYQLTKTLIKRLDRRTFSW